jgi:hypothetical protein
MHRVPRLVNTPATNYLVLMPKPQKTPTPPKPYVRKVRQIGLRLPRDMLDWLEAEAKADDRNVSYVIRLALTEFRQRREKGRKVAAE